MKLLTLALAASIAAAPMAALAADARPALELKPKAALMAAVPQGSGPFVAAAPEPELHFAAPRAVAPQLSRSSCSADRDLCYDANSGHIVFKPVRQFMPGLPGMTAENVLVKKGRVLLHYSF
jgi:hypothetical protein